MQSLKIHQLTPTEVKSLPKLNQEHWWQLLPYTCGPTKQHVAVAYMNDEAVGFVFAEISSETDDREEVMIHRIIWEPRYVYVNYELRRNKVASSIGEFTAQWVASKIIDEFRKGSELGLNVTYQMAVSETGLGGRPTAEKIDLLTKALLKQQGYSLIPINGSDSLFNVIRL